MNYGHIDFAFDILENSKDLKDKYPMLDSIFDLLIKTHQDFQKY